MARSPEPAPPVAANAASVRQAFTSACRLRTGTARRRSLAVATARLRRTAAVAACSQKAGRRTSPADLSNSARLTESSASRMTSPAEKPPRAGASPWPTMRAPLRNSTRTRSMPASAGIGTRRATSWRTSSVPSTTSRSVRRCGLKISGSRAKRRRSARPRRHATRSTACSSAPTRPTKAGSSCGSSSGSRWAPNTRPSTMVCRQSSARSPRRSGRGISRHAPSPPWPTSTAAHHSAFAPCAISFDPASGSAPAA